MHAYHRDKEPLAGRRGAPLRGFASDLVRTFLLFLVHAYQALLRPFFVGTCKFCPTCSEYAVDALRLHGPWQGSLLAGRRLCRCHPFAPGGIDPVPEADSEPAAPDRS